MFKSVSGANTLSGIYATEEETSGSRTNAPPQNDRLDYTF